VDWINPTGARKVHSLVDKVYQRKNLEMAWEKVKANRGSGGVDGQSLEAFAAQLDQQLDRLQSQLKDETYQPQPVRQVQIPKAGKPGEFRMLGASDDPNGTSLAAETCGRAGARAKLKQTSDSS
jgi:retron-type reverse transcriptase